MKKRAKAIVIVLVLLMSAMLVIACTGSKELDALSKPQNLKYENDTIKWDNDTKASKGYSIVIKQGDTEIKNESVSTNLYSVSTLANGSYKAIVKAKAVENEYKESEQSTLDFTISKSDPTPEKTAFGKVTNLTKNNTNITWTAVENATNGYLVKILLASDNSIVGAETTVTTTSYDISALNNGSYKFVIKVKATDAKLESAEETFSFTYEKEKVGFSDINIVFDKATDILSWTEVVDSDGYGIVIKDSSDNIVYENDYLLTNSFSTVELGGGSYSSVITVFAKENSDTYIDTNFDFSFQIDMKEGSLTELVDVKITSDGYFEFTDNNTVNTEYDVTVFAYNTVNSVVPEKINILKEDTTVRLMIPALRLANGDYTINVVAKNNRYANSTGKITKHITIENVVNYNANDIISNFKGNVNSPNETHTNLTLSTINGVPVAKLQPSESHGWGRAVSSEIDVKYYLKPVVYVGIEQVEGKFFVQSYTGKAGTISSSSEKAVFGDTAENGDKIKALDGKGKMSTIIALGVTSGNSAVVYYRNVDIVYVSEYGSIDTTPRNLEKVTNIEVNSNGEISWDYESNDSYATHYDIIITKKDTTVVDTLNNTEDAMYNLTALQDDIYIISIVAKNQEVAYLNDSAVAIKYIIVETVEEYLPQDFASYLTWENSMNPVYNSAANTTTLSSTAHGGLYPKSGVAIDYSKNPMYIFDVVTGNGTYLARSYYTDNSGADIIYDLKNDTTIPTSAQSIALKLAFEKDFKDIKHNVRPVIGLTGTSTLTISGAKITYFYTFDDNNTETPIKLDKVSNAKALGTGMVADIVEGNDYYTPSYQIKVINKTTTLTVLDFISDSTYVDLSVLNIAVGDVYVIEYVTLADNFRDNPYFTDSDPISFEVSSNDEQLDLGSLVGTEQKRAGDDLIYTVNSIDSNAVDVKADSGKLWGLYSFEIDLSSIVTDTGNLTLTFTNLEKTPKVYLGLLINDSEIVDNDSLLIKTKKETEIVDGSSFKFVINQDYLIDGKLSIGIGFGGQDFEDAKGYTVTAKVSSISIIEV